MAEVLAAAGAVIVEAALPGLEDSPQVWDDVCWPEFAAAYPDLDLARLDPKTAASPRARPRPSRGGSPPGPVPPRRDPHDVRPGVRVRRRPAPAGDALLRAARRRDAEIDVGDGDPMDVYRGGCAWFTRPVSLAGLPALSLPAGFDGRGLPLGRAARRRGAAEWTLLRAGAAFQERTDHHRREPTPPGSGLGDRPARLGPTVNSTCTGRCPAGWANTTLPSMHTDSVIRSLWPVASSSARRRARPGRTSVPSDISRRKKATVGPRGNRVGVGGRAVAHLGVAPSRPGGRGLPSLGLAPAEHRHAPTPARRDLLAEGERRARRGRGRSSAARGPPCPGRRPPGAAPPAAKPARLTGTESFAAPGGRRARSTARPGCRAARSVRRLDRPRLQRRVALADLAQRPVHGLPHEVPVVVGLALDGHEERLEPASAASLSCTASEAIMREPGPLLELLFAPAPLQGLGRRVRGPVEQVPAARVAHVPRVEPGDPPFHQRGVTRSGSATSEARRRASWTPASHRATRQVVVAPDPSGERPEVGQPGADELGRRAGCRTGPCPRSPPGRASARISAEGVDDVHAGSIARHGLDGATT